MQSLGKARGVAAGDGPAVTADQRGEHQLLLLGESGQVRMFHQVAGVQLVVAVGNAQPGLVQVGGPAQQLPVITAQ